LNIHVKIELLSDQIQHTLYLMKPNKVKVYNAKVQGFGENALTFGTTNEKNSNSVNEIIYMVVAP
jgi:hypothetical protein